MVWYLIWWNHSKTVLTFKNKCSCLWLWLQRKYFESFQELWKSDAVPQNDWGSVLLTIPQLNTHNSRCSHWVIWFRGRSFLISYTETCCVALWVGRTNTSKQEVKPRKTGRPAEGFYCGRNRRPPTQCQSRDHRGSDHMVLIWIFNENLPKYQKRCRVEGVDIQKHVGWHTELQPAFTSHINHIQKLCRQFQRQINLDNMVK